MEKLQPLEYRQVYGEEPEHFYKYLDGISNYYLIEIASRLIGISHPESKFADPKEFLPWYFCKENIGFAKKVYFKILELKKAIIPRICILYTESSYHFLEYVLARTDQLQKLPSPETERNVFKAYLAINQQISNKKNQLIKHIKGTKEPEISAIMVLGNTIAYTDFVNYNLKQLIASEFIKAFYFFEFAQIKLPYHLNKFLEYFELKNWAEYFEMLVLVVFPLIDNNREGYSFIQITKGKDFEKKEGFLEKFALQKYNYKIGEFPDYRYLREKPLLKGSQGEYRVMSEVFLAEKFFKSLYFKFKEINENLKDEKIKNFHSTYCYEFSEKFLFYKMMKLSFGTKYIQKSGESYNSKEIKGGPDYYIRNGNKIFLFENKDILLSAETKTSYDFDKIVDELKSKLAYDFKENKEKAVYQLARNVKL